MLTDQSRRVDLIGDLALLTGEVCHIPSLSNVAPLTSSLGFKVQLHPLRAPIPFGILPLECLIFFSFLNFYLL